MEHDPNLAIRDNIQNGGAPDWEYKDKAADLYEMSDVFKHYFFGPKNEWQQPLPNLLIAIPLLRIDALAAYRLVPNSLGLSYEVSLNAFWIERPRWELYESLLHEMVHLYEETTDGLTKCKNNYHHQEFVDICEDMGLHPRLGSGAHFKPADGQFARLMDRYAVPPPTYAVEASPDKPKDAWWTPSRGGKPKGSSSLLLYVCDDCVKPSPCKVRSGKKDLDLHCNHCGGDFRLA